MDLGTCRISTCSTEQMRRIRSTPYEYILRKRTEYINEARSARSIGSSHDGTYSVVCTSSLRRPDMEGPVAPHQREPVVL
jgi:hypothetical protein